MRDRLIASAPAPAAAPPRRMLAAQTRMELRLLLRNGEQVGLTLVIPLLLEFFFNLPLLYSLDTPRRIDFVVPSVLALAVMSASFTGLAIGTGFERKYAVLKRLGATALPRRVLHRRQDLRGAAAAGAASRADLRVRAARSAGTRPATRSWAVLLIVLGTFAFGGLGLLLAGTVRAEVTLAAANLIWLILLFAGGIAIPLSRYPGAAARRAALPAVGRAVRRAAPGAAARRRAAGPRRRSPCWSGRRGAAGRGPVVPVGVSTACRVAPPGRVRWLPAGC